MRERVMPPWALILAGGDGTRLRPLTTQIVGDARPKQFCALVDGETLLDRTRRRLDRFVRGATFTRRTTDMDPTVNR